MTSNALEAPVPLSQGEMSVKLALRLLEGGDPGEALAMLESHPPEASEPGWLAALGMVHLSMGDFAQALPVLRAAVALDGRSSTGLINLALAEERAGDAVRARALLEELRQRFPTWDEPPLRQAEALRRAGDSRAAEGAYQRVLAVNPKRPEALLGLAALLVGRGEAVEAQMLMLRCCDAAANLAEAWDLLGISLIVTHDFAAAESAFAEAQRLAPENAALALRRVDAAIAAGSSLSELARLELADPLDVVLLSARAALLEHLGRRDEALDLLELAVMLAPTADVPARARAHLLVRANRITQAVPALQHAIALAPDDLDLQNNFAAALVRLQRHQQAREILEGLIAKHGDHPGLLCNLTNALISLGLHADGIAVAERAIALDPNSNVSWRTLCNALPYVEGVGAAALLRTNRKAGETITRSAAVARGAIGQNPDPKRRLRLGLLSPSLKTHPVGWLTVAAFENLDPTAFEIVCFGPVHDGDIIDRRFRALSTAWHSTDQHANAAQAARSIRTCEIDILIDLGGYGDRGLMALCADRLAPVQVKWVGSQNHSTGLAEMDWFISDRWETPAGFEPFYSERLMRLPDGYVCYSPPSYAPDVGPLPALARGQVTFGCFNNLAKVTSQVIATWAAILRQCPESRLILKCHQLGELQTRERVLAAFARQGVDVDRVALRGSSSHRGLLAEYNDIDIVLDPFPYSGGLTTCEALWMGVPTVTLPGETFASRHATSHVSNVGLTDWIAGDLADYQAIAVAMASDLAGLARLRDGLRARVKASPLCDSTRFGRNLATALRGAWADWCRGR